MRHSKTYNSFSEYGQIALGIIHTIINRIDIKKMHRLIDNIDENAFIVEFDVNNVKGGVLRHYLDKKKNKVLPKL